MVKLIVLVILLLEIFFIVKAQKTYVSSDLVCYGETLTIKCALDIHKIEILQVLFGSNVGLGLDCLSRGTTKCVSNGNNQTQFPIVQNACNGKNSCSINATNEQFGDNCADPRKRLFVKYRCSGAKPASYNFHSQYNPNKRKGTAMRRYGSKKFLKQYAPDKGNTKYICENRDGSITCPGSKVINIVSAKYGSQSSNIQKNCLIGSETPRLCEGSDVSAKIYEICQGNSECQVTPINEQLGGDPCPDTKKYLEIKYTCEKRIARREVVCENDEKTISCPDNRVIRIRSATYGISDEKKNEPLCRRSPNQMCNNSNVKGKVSDQCYLKNSCQLKATNSLVFKDPCYGVIKNLGVSYECI